MAGIVIPFVDAPQVAPRPVGAPQQNLPLSPTGELAAGQGLETLGVGLNQAIEKANQTKVDEALTAGQKSLHDAELAVKKAAGEQAVSASQDAYTAMDDQARQIQENLLTNNAQRDAFQRRWALLREASRYQIETHVAQQTEVASKAAVEGRKIIMKNAAANSAYSLSDTDPANAQATAIAQAPFEQLYADLRKARTLQGFPKDMVDAEVQEYRGQVVATVLQRLVVDGATERARSYLDAHRPELGDAVPELQAQIVAKERAAKADQLAQEITSSKGNLYGDGTVNLPKALGVIDATVKDPVQHALAIEKVKQRAEIIQTGQAKATDQMSASAMAAFTMVNPATGKPNNSIGAVMELAPQAWAYLSDPRNGEKALGMKRTLEAWDQAEKSRARQEGMIATPAQQRKAIEVESWLYANKGNIPRVPVEVFSSQWMQLDPATGEPFLSGQDYQRLGNTFAQMHQNPDAFAISQPKEVILDEMKERFSDLKRPEAKWQDWQLKMKNDLEDKVQREFGGTKPDPVKLREFVRQQLVKVPVQNTFTVGERPRIEYQSRSLTAPELAKVRQQIIEAYQTNQHRSPTEAEIRKSYKDLYGKDP